MKPGYYWIRRQWEGAKPIPAELDSQGRIWFFACDVPLRLNEVTILAAIEFEVCPDCDKPMTLTCETHR